MLSQASGKTTQPTLKEDGANFVLANRATFSWKGIVKAYDITLHLGSGHGPEDVLTNIPMRLELVYHRDFSAAQIIKGGDNLLRRNVGEGTLGSLASRLATFNKAYVDVKKGDAYTLTYVPGRGTTLRLNGAPLTTVPGYDFAASYFRIWLGDEPMSRGLRDELLGR